jgi:hypothetical protein
MRKAILTAVVAVALVGAGGPAAIAAVPGDDDTGTVTVQLTNLAGAPVALAGVQVAAPEGGGNAFEGTTDAQGRATFTGIPTDTTYEVQARSVPPSGEGTYAPAVTGPKSLRPGVTTVIDVRMPVGATITGRLVGPSGAPASGVLVSADGGGSTPFFYSATTDATGRYTIVGVASAIVDLYAYPSPHAMDLTWKTKVVAQTPTGTSAAAVLAATEITGATVRATDVTTGATSDETTSGIVDSDQFAEWDLPSGNYTIEVFTRPVGSTPSSSWWVTAKGGAMTQDPAAAGILPVTFGGHSGHFGVL